jgi:hypothetical protein
MQVFMAFIILLLAVIVLRMPQIKEPDFTNIEKELVEINKNLRGIRASVSELNDKKRYEVK